MGTKTSDSWNRKRIFEIIQIGSRTDLLSRLFDYFIAVMILSNIAVTFMLTFEGLQGYAGLLEGIELFTIIVFIIEYGLRLWTCDYLYPRVDKWHALLKFLVSFYGIVDLLTIISFFDPLYSNGMVALRIVRVIRILRLFRININSDTFNVVADVMQDKKRQLLSSAMMVLMLMLASSLCMYGFEHEAQPEVFRNAFSGIWWAMSTVLTVGYGDIYPITVGGQITAIVIALLGVCVVAIPTGIISAGFVEYDTRTRLETILESDEDGLVNKEVIAALTKASRRKRMSVNEYLLYLMVKDAGHEFDEAADPAQEDIKDSDHIKDSSHGKNASHAKNPNKKRKKK